MLMTMITLGKMSRVMSRLGNNRDNEDANVKGVY
jgi:hypothetical protein